MTPAHWSIRPAGPQDAGDVERLVRELATYERAPDAVMATAADLATALGGDHPLVHAFVAEVDGRVAGMAVWFVSFSTWEGKHGIWLEDLYVSPEHRGLGLGRALLARLAAVAVEHGWARVEWNVLDWNDPAIGFYRRLGAERLEDWTIHRLSDAPLHALATSGNTGNGRCDDSGE
jgi:GNAT superfamily N-acetyltransferase